ncbi:MAG TPA: PLP-dependent aminotransferase family protein [Rhodococcus sp. (in: high G+C Gram-positive bacteria)]|nr:PLP-dependent aminotransferase family protein [Rhodococcus sp. (in: high G+C Gram-positive bacteria)]
MFSRRIGSLRPSPIREILSVLDRPDMVSFAGGLPAPEMLPPLSLSAAPTSLQYGPSEGDPELRAVVSEQLRILGLDAPTERVMILSGSQQGIDLVAKLFVDPGTPVAVESPTYLAALQVFRLYGADFTSLNWNNAPTAPLAYVVPTFANPTGRCATDDERDSLARACQDGGVTLFEDDPYRELAYGPCDRKPVAARMHGGSWVYQGSFSKTFAPGLRLGFLAASEDLFPSLVILKQAVDLHSSTLSQQLVRSAITDPSWSNRLDELASFYRKRRDGFDAALHRHLDGLAEWETPAGGLFFWLRLTRPVDTRALLAAAIDRGVAFMPGEEFFPDRPQLGTMRLNFSHADADATERGLRTLAQLLRDGTEKHEGVSNT